MNIPDKPDKPDKDDFYKKTKHIIILFKFIKNNKQEQFLDYLSSLDPNDLDVNLKDSNGNYLINFAIMMNNRLILKKLIQYGSRLDIIDSEGHGILYYPIKFSYSEIIDILLEYNKKTLGVSLVNIRDSKGSVPLFYAIRYDNDYALQELLSNGADANYKSSDGITPLHLAVLKKNITMVRQITKYDKNLDFPSYSGLTALHYACNFQLYDIAKLLVEKGAGIDVSDLEFDFTPVFYSAVQNNVPITKILIDKQTNPNHQDYMGNTFCHYCIENNHYEIIDYIFEKYSITNPKTNIYSENINNQITTKTIIPTLVNLDGLTIGHLLVYYYKDFYDKYLNIIIPHCDLNYQDNNGNTILHLLVASGIWDKFIDNLAAKKLNIYVKNNNNKTVLDVLPLRDREKFIDVVSTSYYNYLNKYENSWIENWQNNCSMTSQDDKKNECIAMIRKNIIKKNVSLPSKVNKLTIILDNYQKVNFSTFTGSSLDLVCGFKYLTKKYKNTVTLLHSDQDITKELSDYYNSMGIRENPNQHIIQMEIKWIYQRLFLPPNFEFILSTIIKNAKHRYFIIPIGIILSNGSHTNGLFYDIESKVMERFEPHGSSYPNQFNYNPKLLDDILQKRMTNILSLIYKTSVTITYLKPSNYTPKIGFQMFENTEISVNKNIGDPNGFCTLWTVWYLDYRLKYHNVHPQKIIKKLLSGIKFNNKSYRDTIRDYSKLVTDLRDTYLATINRNINDYLNNRIQKTDLKKVIIEILSDN